MDSTFILVLILAGILIYTNGGVAWITSLIKSKLPVSVTPLPGNTTPPSTTQVTQSQPSQDKNALVHAMVDNWLAIAALADDAESKAALNTLRNKILTVPGK